MEFEFVDRRGEKKAAEAAAPSVLEVVEDRMNRASAALANGDLAAANAVVAECKNPPTMYGDVVEFKKTVRGERHQWKSVAFTIVAMQVGQAQVLCVRAAGLRTDEKMFTADYMLSPWWEGEGDFSEEARKRLGTFLACSCESKGPCKFHAENVPGPLGPGKWMEEDLRRIQKTGATAMPECLEVLMKAEAARQQSRVFVPGRG